MPLLAEELMNLTLEELIQEHGAEFIAQEHWWGYEFNLRVGGLCLYATPVESISDDDLFPIITDEHIENIHFV